MFLQEWSGGRSEFGGKADAFALEPSQAAYCDAVVADGSQILQAVGCAEAGGIFRDGLGRLRFLRPWWRRMGTQLRGLSTI